MCRGKKPGGWREILSPRVGWVFAPLPFITPPFSGRALSGHHLSPLLKSASSLKSHTNGGYQLLLLPTHHSHSLHYYYYYLHRPPISPYSSFTEFPEYRSRLRHHSFPNSWPSNLSPSSLPKTGPAFGFRYLGRLNRREWCSSRSPGRRSPRDDAFQRGTVASPALTLFLNPNLGHNSIWVWFLLC